uniref:Wu:fj29h11 n=1 Tax=Seriola dumerili TaxID=41447 RepID=A0A3B4U8T9_SERDU
MLAGLVQRQRGLAGGGLSQVYYESALFAKHSKSRLEAVGRLGEMSKAQALASLLSCPLLEDLSEWSQWDLIFKPIHGSLKEFIERHAANTGLEALEVTPGSLLRITTHTGAKHFSSAAMTLDPVGTAGHLVSMVVADGIVNAPTALLANHMQSSLAAAVAKEGSDVVQFLINTRFSPFSSVLGQAKSKQVLITVAQSDPRHMNCLHRLGILLGITDWIKDYQKKLNPPQSHAYSSHTAPFNLIDSESSSLSNLNTSEDEDVMDNGFVSSQLNQSPPQGGCSAHRHEDRTTFPSSVFNSGPDEPSSRTSGWFLFTTVSDVRCVRSGDVVCSADLSLPLSLRKSEFGIGVELTAEGQKLMQVHQDRLGRSLERLSTELYSKDTHFVLELIQNADDNSYPSEVGVVPSLAFVVEKDCITVLNNEIGFQERNIKAICDVGCSTKGKHKYGYIGQKGIGFKSVFKVTDCPEIHSNGFHLRFDRTCGSMGYILPHWTEDERPVDAQLKNVNHISWTTKICLPLRSESHQTRNLFHDVHPSLLLFLHRLRSIIIYNQVKRLMTMTRKDLSHDVLEVEHTEGVERWLVVKTTLEPKKIKENVESTELALAFQLCSDSAGSDIICQPQKQPVFAYLPLRSFGLRFIVQGDFDIPSSREDVDRDSPWNQWLRSEIPQLFLHAMDVFTNHPEFRGLKGLCQFLQFIPLPDEVLDFFKPVAGQIIQLLKGKAFLPTLSSDSKVVYKLPSQVAVCQDPVIREVIGGDELERHLSLSYLHPDLSPAPPTSLLTHLGVRHLRGSDVTTVTTAMAKELMKEEGIHSDAGLRRLARLLVCNFRALEHGYAEADSILQTLKDLPIIPLADGSVVALSGGGVFFPMEESPCCLFTGPLSALYKDVNVVHPSLLSCVEPLESQQVRELLRRLGVHELEPQELLEQHIYPSIRNNKWKLKPEAVVVSYLVFIKQHSSSSQYSDVAVPVLTSRGLLCPGQDRVHFSEEYGNINLPQELPGCDWILLSPCYVQTDGDVAGWRELFSRLGVRDGLIIRKETQTLSASSHWSSESTMWRLIPGEGCVLDDYPCEEFRALATAQLPDAVLLQQRTALLKLLATNWDTGHRYSQFLTAQVIDSDGRAIKDTTSSFSHALRRLDWLPAYRPLEGDKRERKFLCPNSVYLTSPEVTSLLGTHVFYVDLDPSDFSRALGKDSISVEALITYLKEWCVKPEEQRQPGDESEGAGFISTIQHIHNMYSYLHTNCPQSSLKELFQHTPAVFIEYNRYIVTDDWCSGRFYHLKEVCWSDTTTMFQRYKQLIHSQDSSVQEPKLLAPFYSQLDGMKDFFTRLLSVEPSPNMNQYVGLMELICSSSPIPTAEVLQDVSVLYARLAQKCKIPVSGEQENTFKLNQSYCSTLKGMVSDKRVFPTKDSSWVSLARKPMIADNRELEKIFKHRQQVCLLHLPPADKKARANSAPAFKEKDRSLFLEICGIRPLSHCVKTEPQTENLRPCPPMQAMVRFVVPYIQRFLYHHEELGDVYSDLIDNNIGEKIKRLYFGQVGKLYIRYQLDVADIDVPVVELQDVICLLKDEKELYIQKDHLTARLDICRELVKLFCTESDHRKELMHFLSALITTLDDAGALNRLLQKEDIRELPREEEQWEVPEPPRPDMNLDRGTESDQSIRYLHKTTFPMTHSVCVPTGQTGGGVVEAVMKMWPPPAAPKDRDPERDAGPREGSYAPPQSPSSSEGNQPLRSSRPPDQPLPHRALSHPGLPHPAAVTPNISSTQPPPGNAFNKPPSVRLSVLVQCYRENPVNVVIEPKAAPPINIYLFIIDQMSGEVNIKYLMIHFCTVVLSDDAMDVAAIGEWGEQLVNSFLCDWRDGDDPGRPAHVLWCNQSGESGQPYDFRLTFGAGGGAEVVYVEVKSTIKKEKSFIHLSANELDLALREKERYHIFRVYSAGDAHNVRLVRIRNLAQHLHTKDLALYLFV